MAPIPSRTALLLLSLLALAPARAAALDAPDGRMQWSVWREGERIGSYTMTRRHQQGALIVDQEIDITVRVMFVPVFRYIHRDQETWREGRLVGLTAFTDDDGKRGDLDATPVSNGLVVDGPAGRFLAPPTVLPSSLWQIEMTKAPLLLDVESGNLLAVQAKMGAEEPVLGAEGDVLARHITMTGDLQRELWYGADGYMLREQFAGPDGTTIEFRREK